MKQELDKCVLVIDEAMPRASLPTQRPSWASHGAGCGRNW